MLWVQVQRFIAVHTYSCGSAFNACSELSDAEKSIISNLATGDLHLLIEGKVISTDYYALFG